MKNKVSKNLLTSFGSNIISLFNKTKEKIEVPDSLIESVQKYLINPKEEFLEDIVNKLVEQKIQDKEQKENLKKLIKLCLETDLDIKRDFDKCKTAQQRWNYAKNAAIVCAFGLIVLPIFLTLMYPGLSIGLGFIKGNLNPGFINNYQDFANIVKDHIINTPNYASKMFADTAGMTGLVGVIGASISSLLAVFCAHKSQDTANKNFKDKEDVLVNKINNFFFAFFDNSNEQIGNSTLIKIGESLGVLKLEDHINRALSPDKKQEIREAISEKYSDSIKELTDINTEIQKVFQKNKDLDIAIREYSSTQSKESFNKIYDILSKNVEVEKSELEAFLKEHVEISKNLNKTQAHNYLKRNIFLGVTLAASVAIIAPLVAMPVILFADKVFDRSWNATFTLNNLTLPYTGNLAGVAKEMIEKYTPVFIASIASITACISAVATFVSHKNVKETENKMMDNKLTANNITKKFSEKVKGKEDSTISMGSNRGMK